MKYIVFVKFNSRPYKIQLTNNEIIIYLRSRPERGKTTKELISKLASYFGVSKDNVHINSGLTSTKKLIEVEMENQTF